MRSHRPHRGQAVREPQLVDVVHAEVHDLVRPGMGVAVDESGQDVHARRVDFAVAGRGPGSLDQVRSRDGGDAVALDDDVHRAARRSARPGDVVHAADDQPGVRPFAPVRRVALGGIDRSSSMKKYALTISSPGFVRALAAAMRASMSARVSSRLGSVCATAEVDRQTAAAKATVIEVMVLIVLPSGHRALSCEGFPLALPG